MHLGCEAAAGDWFGGPSCPPFPSTNTSLGVSPVKGPRRPSSPTLFRTGQQKSASLKCRLVYKCKAFFSFFSQECFGALADCYFNSFPQMFLPYLGKTRDRRTFCMFFHEKLQGLGGDQRAWGLFPLVGDLGLNLHDQLSQSLFKSRFTNNRWTLNKKCQPIKILRGTPTALPQRSLSLGQRLSATFCPRVIRI